VIPRARLPSGFNPSLRHPQRLDQILSRLKAQLKFGATYIEGQISRMSEAGKACGRQVGVADGASRLQLARGIHEVGKAGHVPTGDGVHAGGQDRRVQGGYVGPRYLAGVNEASPPLHISSGSLICTGPSPAP